MEKIKDFTLASKNLGGTCPSPVPTHLPPMVKIDPSLPSYGVVVPFTFFLQQA